MSHETTAGAQDEDEIVAEYDVFITTDLAEQIYLLQYPTRLRDTPYNARTGNVPLEMRIKPKTGFMEVDIGFDVRKNFDKHKGVVWGEALRMTKAAGADSFGLAAGFGKGQKTTEAMVADADNPADDSNNIDRLLSEFDRLREQGHVLTKQTLGGQIVRPEPGRPMYMLGAFRGNELHLSTVTGVAAMRPQFHHIDAKGQLAKATKTRERMAEYNGRTESRLITQRAQTADDEELNIEKTENFLQEAADERWLKLQYHDEDTDQAYVAYGSSLFLKDTENATKLKSPWDNDRFLDEISIPRIEPGNRIRKKPPLTRKQLADMQKEAEEDAVAAAAAEREEMEVDDHDEQNGTA